MKPKTLLVLVVIVAILAGLVLLKKSTREAPDIGKEAGLVPLIPEGLKTYDIAKIELYAGAKPDDEVVLAKVDSDKWQVESHYNGPVKADTINKYLEALVGLKGEFRATADTPEALDEYDLKDDEAFHVLGYRKDETEPAFHVLTGKASDYRTVLMRNEDGDKVFVEATNLRQQAGVYGTEIDKAPEPGTWFDKQALDLDKDKVTRVAVVMPDKRLVFEQQAKEAEKAKEEETSEAETEPSEPAEETAEPEPAQVEYEWVLAESGPKMAHKQAALDNLLGKLDSLSATDLVDPAKKSEWGLEPPAFTCTVSVKDVAQGVALEGGWPDRSEDGYLQVASDGKDVVYKISKYNFTQLWPNGAALFDLPSLDLDQATITRIEVNHPEGRVVAEKKDGQWVVVEPSADLPVVATTFDTMARTLAKWKPADYADSAEGAGLGNPERSVIITAGEATHTIALGADALSVDGAYARLDDNPMALAMSRTDIDKVFVAPKDVFERTLLDVDETDVTEVTVSHGEASFALNKEDETWKLTAADGSFSGEADADAVSDLLTALADLQGTDILFGAAAIEAETAYAAIRFAGEDGAEQTVVIGAEREDGFPAQVAGKATVFLLGKEDVEELLPAVGALKKPEPEPAAETAETATEEAPEVAVEPEATEFDEAPETPEAAKPEEAEEAPESPEAQSDAAE